MLALLRTKKILNSTEAGHIFLIAAMTFLYLHLKVIVSCESVDCALDLPL